MTSRIDESALNFEDVENSYVSSPRGPLTRTEFEFFVKIVGELLNLSRMCGARGLGIVTYWF